MKKVMRRSAIITMLVVLLLALTVSFASASGGSGSYHKVHYGETLFSIGRYYGVNPYLIADVNGLYNPNHIYAGQVLYIPSGYDGGSWGKCGGYDCGADHWKSRCDWNDCGGNRWHDSKCGWDNCRDNRWHDSKCGWDDCRDNRWHDSKCGWDNCRDNRWHDSKCGWDNCRDNRWHDSKCGWDSCGGDHWDKVSYRDGHYGSNYHVVRYGETLYSIGRHYGVSPWAIADANGIYKIDYIYAGEVLYIPSGGGYYW